MRILLIRHCKAIGQHPDAKLTREGFEQAERLRDFLRTQNVKRLISSPYKRALQSIEPFSTEQNLSIEKDDRLMERVLSSSPLEDWESSLKRTFEDPDLSFEGGESSRTALERVRPLLTAAAQTASNIAIVTHGNLMALILRHYFPSFGFNEWRRLSNPDVFLVENESEATFIHRIWPTYRGYKRSVENRFPD